jgi:hypothetical protein
MFRHFVFAAAFLVASPAIAQTYDVEALGVPRFVDVNYLALNKITAISKFRSSTGHDQADSFETCRSMKHYFIAHDPTVPVYAPVTGTVTRILADTLGTQVRITADAQPAFTFILYHVGLSSQLSEGARVTAGQQLGTHVSNQTYSDIAVRVDVGGGNFRYVSYFETLTDTAFAAFQSRGITSRDQLIISRQARDAAPYTCNGETFVNAAAPASSEWAALSALPRLLVGPMYPGARTDARSFLRFHNQGTAPGSVSVDFIDAATGTRVAQWRSPAIPPGASPQFVFSIMEAEARPTSIPSTYYTLDISSEFPGRFQHVVVDTAAFLLLNTAPARPPSPAMRRSSPTCMPPFWITGFRASSASLIPAARSRRRSWTFMTRRTATSLAPTSRRCCRRAVISACRFTRSSATPGSRRRRRLTTTTYARRRRLPAISKTWSRTWAPASTPI